MFDFTFISVMLVNMSVIYVDNIGHLFLTDFLDFFY